MCPEPSKVWMFLLSLLRSGRLGSALARPPAALSLWSLPNSGLDPPEKWVLVPQTLSRKLHLGASLFGLPGSGLCALIH